MFFVILSEAKEWKSGHGLLRFAQDDTLGRHIKMTCSGATEDRGNPASTPGSSVASGSRLTSTHAEA
jgi:hypothetical protein